MEISYFSRNTKLFRTKITTYWRSFNRWFLNTPERAILEAYQAAQTIKSMENEQFGGQKISPELGNNSQNMIAFWQGELNRNLTIIKVRIAEFNLGITFIDIGDINVLEKLRFIDEVISKYNQEYPENIDVRKEQDSIQKNSIFPISISQTFNKIVKYFAPKAEQEFIKKYQISRTKTRKAVQFLLILIIIPIITQHFSKKFLLFPLFKHFRIENTTQIFLTTEIEEKALNELKNFEKKLQFQNLLYQAPKLSPATIETKVKNKAIQIAAEFRDQNSNAISNVFADLISLISFAIVIVIRKKDIIFLQYLIDKIVYGLSDSAKAFLIILLTDIFVGFHSPHGWEIILEGLANHLGLAASRKSIFLFIATFPVILNTIFKYWIFRYLSRLSPSALATLKEMDE